MKATRFYHSAIQALWVASALIITASCGSGSRQPEATAAQATIPDSVSGKQPAITLSAAQMDAVGIILGSIEQKNLHAVIRASGQLAVPPQNKADVNVLIGGIVRRIQVLEGQAVRKGQVLAQLENQEFIKMQQDYLATLNAFAFTQQEYQRQKELHDADAGTEKNWQQVQADYNVERAKIRGLGKQLEQLGISPSSVAAGRLAGQVAVLAPIGGTIGHIAVNTGTYAEPGKPLMQIIDNSSIHCDLIVYEKDLFKVKAGQRVSFMLTNQDNRQIQGEIYGVNKSFEDESKGIIVHAVIKNADRYKLIQGMHVTALIDIGSRQTPAVPVEAVVRSGGRDYLFMVDTTAGHDPGVLYFKMVEIATGVAELGYVQVTPLEELPAGARVITRNAFYLLSKLKSGGEEE